MDFKDLCGQVYHFIKGKTHLKQAPSLWENSDNTGLLSQWYYYMMEGSLQAKED